MMLNQSVRVRDLPASDKWKAVSDGETMLVHIVMPKAEESAQAATETAPVPGAPEPEVIKKGKDEKDDKK
ncbi:hypothetical protein D3C83_29310 [compost metagenome]